MTAKVEELEDLQYKVSRLQTDKDKLGGKNQELKKKNKRLDGQLRHEKERV